MNCEKSEFTMKKIGSRIRQYRKASDYSMKDLAEALDISVSYLSQIENGRVNISVVMLYEIVNVLDIPSVTHLLDDFETAPVNIIRRDDRRSIKYSENLKQDFLCSTREYQLEVNCLHLQPGSISKPVNHQGDELCYVLEGKIRLMLNDGLEEYILEQDDAAEYSAGITHQFENVGEDQASLLLAVTPIAF